MKEKWIYLVFKNVSEQRITKEGMLIGRPIKCFNTIEKAVAYLESITARIEEDVWDEDLGDEFTRRYDEGGCEIWIESRCLE